MPELAGNQEGEVKVAVAEGVGETQVPRCHRRAGIDHVLAPVAGLVLDRYHLLFALHNGRIIGGILIRAGVDHSAVLVRPEGVGVVARPVDILLIPLPGQLETGIRGADQLVDAVEVVSEHQGTPPADISPFLEGTELQLETAVGHLGGIDLVGSGTRRRRKVDRGQQVASLLIVDIQFAGERTAPEIEVDTEIDRSGPLPTHRSVAVAAEGSVMLLGQDIR